MGASAKQRQEIERVPLKKYEYGALQALFGAVNAFKTQNGHLEKRYRMIPGLWRDVRLVETLAEKILSKTLHTIPVDKLMAIHKELTHTTVEVKVNRDVTGRQKDKFCYVPEDPLVRTVGRLCAYHCQFCDKSPAEVKKCECRKDVARLYMWELESDEICPLANVYFKP